MKLHLCFNSLSWRLQENQQFIIPKKKKEANKIVQQKQIDEAIREGRDQPFYHILL
jgi:heat shock protein HspQ